jgi:ribosomal RNA-processing protein 9
MAFFKRGNKREKSSKKSGSEVKAKKPRIATKPKSKQQEDNEISSEEDEGMFNDARNARYKEHSDDEYEDVQHKAYREAKALLEKVKDTEEVTDDDEDDAIKHRLIKDAQVKLGVLHRKLADKLNIDEDSTLIYRPHRYSPVSIAISKDSRFIVSCSKDGSVVKYDLQEEKKGGSIKFSKTSENHHHGIILCVAISPDNQYLVTGGADKQIKVWKFDTLQFVQDLGNHRGAVTSLIFRQSGALELYSGSTDRSIKAWNLDQMGFVDIMFGHQDSVLQLDMLNKPRVLSCGGQDRTVRLFKVMEESQLVFNGFSDCLSIDTVAFVDDDHFVSGSADGSLCAWAAFKKKPLSVIKEAHGRNRETNEPLWITSVAAAHNSDLIVSGSSNGFLKFWQVSTDYKSLKLVKQIELKGFINDLKFIENGRKLVCAVGQEHKSGRWWKISDSKNSIVILTLNKEDTAAAVTATSTIVVE